MISTDSHRTALSITRLTRWRGERRVARILFSLTVVALIGMFFAPWQQNAVGTGRVIAYSPNERALEVQAPVEGRVVRWRFNEGEHVERGDVIVELSDNDPQVLERYRRQRDASQGRVEASERSIAALQEQIASIQEMRELTLQAADAQIFMAQNQVEAARMRREAAEAKEQAAAIQRNRVTTLAAEGLDSQRDLELARRNALEAKADVKGAEAALLAAKSTVAAKRAERESKASELDAKMAEVRDKLFDAKAKLANAQTNLAEVERALARQNSLEVEAPRAGMLLEVTAREGSAYVEQGEKLAVVVPSADQRAVELFISGNDAPLVVTGQRVQLQFEGWPAIQFAGWPEAAVGTFSGEVSFVDAKAQPDGRFRVVAVQSDDADWPDDEVLRQGNAVNGWVLLNEVPLGYELWRQLNGFPPDLPPEAADASGYALK